ncbi:MAG: hypothetical protein AAFX32_00705 [Pseudomonadota bacterium]
MAESEAIAFRLQSGFQSIGISPLQARTLRDQHPGGSRVVRSLATCAPETRKLVIASFVSKTIRRRRFDNQSNGRGVYDRSRDNRPFDQNLNEIDAHQ